jgi:FkbM family methyltransferase
VKSLLKKVLNKKQRTALVQCKEDCVLGFSRGMAGFISFVLPRRILVNVKSNLKIKERLDYSKKDIYLTVDSDIEYVTRRKSCRKEPETVNWIETGMKKGDVLYDIGANVGAYSLLASKYFDGDIKVFAFEPGFQNYHQLVKNVVLNNAEGSVVPLYTALSKETKLDQFNYSTLEFGGAHNALGVAVDYQKETFKPVFQQRIFAFSIDDLVEKYAIPSPNHMKIDVDGIELDILKGAPNTLKQPTLKSILVELEENGSERVIVDMLKQNGFKLASKHKYIDGGTEGPFSKSYNYIFMRV